MPKLIVPLGFIFASIAIIIFFIIPGWQRFLVVRADTKHLDEINAEIDTLTKKRDALNDQIIGITKENFDRLDQMVPSAVLGPEFLVFLEQLAHAHGLNVRKLDLSSTLSTKAKIVEKKVKGPGQAINATGQVSSVAAVNMPGTPSRVPETDISGFNAVSGQTKTQAYQTFNVGMDVNGSYEAFKSFLRDLELSIRITDVESLNFSPPFGGLDAFSFNLTLTTYYQ